MAVQAAPAPRSIAPRWGLGIAGGHTVHEGGRDGDELAVLGRLRVAPALELELELARTEFDAGDRVDRRSAAAVYWMLVPHAIVVPYLVGGLGVGEAEMLDGAAVTAYGYAELGGGLEWRLTDRLSIAGDLRAGGRAHDVQDDCDAAACEGTPLPMDREERYTRGRLLGMLYF